MLRKVSIPALRQQIDRIDDQLLRLLSRRAELALAIAEQKARSNSEVYAPAREKGVLERLARANRGPLPAHLVRGASAGSSRPPPASGSGPRSRSWGPRPPSRPPPPSRRAAPAPPSPPPAPSRP